MPASGWRRWAAFARRWFDRTPPRIGAVTVVGILAGLSAFTGSQQAELLQRGCAPLPISLARLEVTFSGPRFAALLHGEGKCEANVIASFVTWDLVFPIFYGLLFCATYLWAERWRRFDAADTPIPHPPSRRRDALVIAPLVAALLDALFENLPLWFAARALAASPDPAAAMSALITGMVVLGSTAAVLKWLLLLLATAAIIVEVLSGPRGAVLWRVRFSALAVVLGGVPMLAVPQGRDILQRLVEGGEQTVWVVLAAVAPSVFAAVAVWYCARKLTELDLGTGAYDPAVGTPNWWVFFAEQVPRLLGILLLFLVGLAFATAGLAAERFVGVGVVGFLVALLARRYWGRFAGFLGRLLTLPRWRHIPGLQERVGRLIFACAAGLLIVFPDRWLGEPVTLSIFGQADNANERTLFYLRFAAYLCLVAAWIFQLVVRFRRQASRSSEAADSTPPLDSVSVDAVGTGLKVGVTIAALVSFGWLIAFTTVPVPVGRAIGPLWILSLATVNAVFIGSVTVWAGKRFRIPVVSAVLVMALLFSLWNDNHDVRLIESSSAADVNSRPAVETHFKAWLAEQQRGNPTPEPRVVLVAAAGGGLRAAYWAAMSMAVIQDRVPGFDRHVFAFSGVSGGSLGGALFASMTRDAAGGTPTCRSLGERYPRPPAVTGAYAECVRTFMSDDHLSPVLAKLLAPDLLQWFLPFAVHAFDRSTALEESWEDSYESTVGRDTFREGLTELVRDPSVRVRLPVLLLNSTHVETGRRYVASTVIRREAPGPRTLQDAGDVLDILQKDLRLSTAVHNSARFTYVSPAGHLDPDDGIERGRVVDGGYFENSGLSSLREIYELLKKSEPVEPYVLYLCNDPLSCGAADTPPGRNQSFPSTAADELLSPVRALLRTRDARGSLARASLRELAADRFLQLNVCREAPPKSPTQSEKVEQARDRVVSPPLGWLLSRLARDWMDASLASGSPKADGNCYERNAYAIDRMRILLAAPSPSGTSANDERASAQ